MKKIANRTILALVAVGLMNTLVDAQYVCSSPKSVLANIDCGGQASCMHLTDGPSGAVRCTCIASCSSPMSTAATVGATRAVVWGAYVAGGYPCNVSVFGIATGGTQAGMNPAINSAVFANTSVSGGALTLQPSSSQVVDCFYGTITDEPVINGVC
jgi:hypothetical protein